MVKLFLLLKSLLLFVLSASSGTTTRSKYILLLQLLLVALYRLKAKLIISHSVSNSSVVTVFEVVGQIGCKLVTFRCPLKQENDEQ